MRQGLSGLRYLSVGAGLPAKGLRRVIRGQGRAYRCVLLCQAASLSALHFLIHFESAMQPTGTDVFFLLIGAAMVLAMHAGFAFLEVGTVREKNQVNTLAACRT